MPALRVATSEGEKARMWSAVERVQQLGTPQRVCAGGLEQLPLQLRGMGRYAGCRQAVLGQHAANGGEAVERAGVEGRAEEAARVLGVADASRRERQILEL